MLILLKGPSYILGGGKRVDSLIKGGRSRPRLIMPTLLKGPSYILGGGERVNNFIKKGRLR
jgi:NOL1/NOP2/fmu family ribosome biogenesis protein